MKNVIVGTAGHVDHGKTCLIKALSGIDTDRLKEEKKRGITIENGFADMEIEGYRIGIIDVPGHERFVSNMLMGIGGIDLVLLVIGLDEGVMPQTVEHFRILTMLDIPKGIIVYTKRDLVSDEDWKNLVKEDVRELVKGSFMEGAPEIEVSSFDGFNIEELKKLIVDSIDDGALKNESDDLFRLPVDRVFTMEGFGTVVTGTLMEGSVKSGDEIMIYPEEQLAKVRNIEVHGSQVDRAYAGQRTAINLQKVKKEDLERGAVLSRPGSLTPTMMLDVKLELFPDAEKSVANGSRVHFHTGASSVLAKVVLLDRDILEKGESCYAQLRLEDSIVARRNDRFIIRFYSPLISIGGGKILEPLAKKHKRGDEKVLKSLRIKDEGGMEEIAALLILDGAGSMGIGDLKIALKTSEEKAKEIVSMLEEKGEVIDLGGAFIHSETLGVLERGILKDLKEYHELNQMSPGMNKEELKSRLAKISGIKDRKSLDKVMDIMADKGAIRKAGSTYADPEFKISYSPEMEALKATIMSAYEKGGYDMPETEELIGSQKDEVNARHILEGLLREGWLVKISPKYCINKELYDEALKKMKEHIESNGRITLAEFRDIIGSSRKYAMALLDHWDQENITQKIEDYRILRRCE